MNRRQAIVIAVASIASAAGLRRASAADSSEFVRGPYTDDLRLGFERSYTWHSGQDDEASVVLTAAALDSSNVASKLLLDASSGS